MYRELPFEARLVQLQEKVKELEAIKRRSLGKLLTSSYAVLIWSLTLIFIFLGTKSLIEFPALTSLITIPLVVNGAAWLYWGVMGYLSSQKELYQSGSYEDEDIEIKHLYKQLEYLNFVIRRQKKIESMLDLFVAIQFASIAFILTGTLTWFI